jgi:hypothetical protein
MLNDDIDTHMRTAAFEHVRMLAEIHDNLTASLPTTAAVHCRACLSRCFWTRPMSFRTSTSGWASRWCPTAFRCRKSIMLPSMRISSASTRTIDCMFLNGS